MTNCITEECQNTNLQPDEIDQLIAEFHHTIGWNSVDECMLPSSYLSSGTWEQILDATALVLESYGNGFIDNIRERVEFWNKNLGDIHANDKPLVDDLPGLMSDLKQQCEGVIIAICTSDDRRATKACVKNWKLEGHIDVSNYYVYKYFKVSALQIKISYSVVSLNRPIHSINNKVFHMR
jgi:hypothetical protein